MKVFHVYVVFRPNRYLHPDIGSLGPESTLYNSFSNSDSLVLTIALNGFQKYRQKVGQFTYPCRTFSKLYYLSFGSFVNNRRCCKVLMKTVLYLDKNKNNSHICYKKTSSIGVRLMPPGVVFGPTSHTKAEKYMIVQNMSSIVFFCQ